MKRRNAMMGWVVYKAAKPLVRRAIRSRVSRVVPGKRGRSRGRKSAALGLALAALFAARAFGRRRGADEDG